jgi:hypothetical protein
MYVCMYIYIWFSPIRCMHVSSLLHTYLPTYMTYIPAHSRLNHVLQQPIVRIYHLQNPLLTQTQNHHTLSLLCLPTYIVILRAYSAGQRRRIHYIPASNCLCSVHFFNSHFEVFLVGLIPTFVFALTFTMHVAILHYNSTFDRTLVIQGAWQCTLKLRIIPVTHVRNCTMVRICDMMATPPGVHG